MRVHVKVTTQSGNTFTTAIHAYDEQAAIGYFFYAVMYIVTEDEATGQETHDKIVSVDILPQAKPDTRAADDQLLHDLGVQL